MIVYLIGFMASGKTTVGKKLAKELGYLFIDMDAYLERKYQNTIPELFEQKGEEEFRRLERQCLVELSNMDNAVISTGGGAPCFFDNIDLMNKSGFTIYLESTTALIADRLSNAKEERPLLRGWKDIEDLKSIIEERLAVRKPFYQQAQLTVNAANVKVKELADAIASLH